mmetsp:Transcript_87933/g.252020  ORF Transcript_87933/g.252020 Transcript_87933/m.252020 type:complete len:228 (+) Transcript_87933:1060-1743(+)
MLSRTWRLLSVKSYVLATKRSNKSQLQLPLRWMLLLQHMRHLLVRCAPSGRCCRNWLSRGRRSKSWTAWFAALPFPCVPHSSNSRSPARVRAAVSAVPRSVLVPELGKQARRPHRGCPAALTELLWKGASKPWRVTWQRFGTKASCSRRPCGKCATMPRTLWTTAWLRRCRRCTAAWQVLWPLCGAVCRVCVLLRGVAGAWRLPLLPQSLRAQTVSGAMEGELQMRN